jgi:hypothetical protein
MKSGYMGLIFVWVSLLASGSLFATANDPFLVEFDKMDEQELNNIIPPPSSLDFQDDQDGSQFILPSSKEGFSPVQPERNKRKHIDKGKTNTPSIEEFEATQAKKREQARKTRLKKKQKLIEIINENEALKKENAALEIEKKKLQETLFSTLDRLFKASPPAPL